MAERWKATHTLVLSGNCIFWILMHAVSSEFQNGDGSSGTVSEVALKTNYIHVLKCTGVTCTSAFTFVRVRVTFHLYCGVKLNKSGDICTVLWSQQFFCISFINFFALVALFFAGSFCACITHQIRWLHHVNAQIVDNQCSKLLASPTA